jgi:hypothetical protein
MICVILSTIMGTKRRIAGMFIILLIYQRGDLPHLVVEEGVHNRRLPGPALPAALLTFLQGCNKVVTRL